MSSRQTRTGTMERSIITTRSRAQKFNAVNENINKSIEKIKRSKKKEKATKTNKNLETNTKKVTKSISPSAKKTSSPVSVKKKVSRREHTSVKKVESENEFKTQKRVKASKSNKKLKNRRNDDLKGNSSKKSSSRLSNSDDLDLDNTLEQEITITNANSIVTPKSTPFKCDLTPHRSTKTPKRSPISIPSSPKTHTVNMPKLLKVPRKLSLTIACEQNLDTSNLDNEESQGQYDTDRDSSLDSIFSFDKTLSASSAITNKHKKSHKNLKKIVRKFSKSPKIVLRSPKSKKSRSPKLKVVSPSQSKKSTIKKSFGNAAKVISDLNISKPLNISIEEDSSIKHRLLNSKLSKKMSSSQIKDILAKPIVLLEKLSPIKMKNMLTVINRSQSDGSIKMRSPVVNLTAVRNNPKVLHSAARRSSDSMVVHLKDSHKRSVNKLMNNPVKSVNRLSLHTKHDLPLQGKRKSSISFVSSSPLVEKIPLIDINLRSNTPIVPLNVSSNTRSKYKNQSIEYMSQIDNLDKNAFIENVSEPSLLDKDFSDINRTNISNISKRTITYNDEDIAIMLKKKTNKNETYELEEPQTPNLQQIIKKHTSIANLSLNEDNNRTCKVRFAKPTPTKNSVYKPLDKPIISHNDSIKKSMTTKKIETPRSNRNSLTTPFKVKPSSTVIGSTSKSELNRKIFQNNKMTSNISRNEIQTTPKISASIETKSEKKSSIKRKLPNFGKIHEKLFAKSESVVDAKKRLEDRHLAFTTNRVLSKPNIKEGVLPSDSNGTYNRFGFKVRKPEATQVMLSKQTVLSREKRQNETRMILKGVRTNRRFELQMKSRNMKA